MVVFSHRAAEISFWATVGVWGVGERVLTFPQDLRARAWRSRQDTGSYYWILTGIIAGFAAGLALAAGHVLSLPGPLAWLVVGLIVAWTGMLLRWWAVLTLGQCFTTRVMVVQEQRVISSGPYRMVRHPSYLGVLILFLGLGVALGSLASAVVMVVLPAIGLVRRIRVEEAVLCAGLGDSYLEYCNGRARLVPGVW
jgi:protein-S-isoprenylcysteine O-methyltransferase Ste14